MGYGRQGRRRSPPWVKFTHAMIRVPRDPGLNSPSQELPEQTVHFLRRVLLRPMRDARQPLNAQIADVVTGAIETWQTQRDVLFAPDHQRWRLDRRVEIGGGHDV